MHTCDSQKGHPGGGGKIPGAPVQDNTRRVEIPSPMHPCKKEANGAQSVSGGRARRDGDANADEWRDQTRSSVRQSEALPLERAHAADASLLPTIVCLRGEACACNTRSARVAVSSPRVYGPPSAISRHLPDARRGGLVWVGRLSRRFHLLSPQEKQAI